MQNNSKDVCLFGNTLAALSRWDQWNGWQRLALKGKRAAWQGHLLTKHSCINGRCCAWGNSECCLVLQVGKVDEHWALSEEVGEKKRWPYERHQQVSNSKMCFPNATAPASTLTRASWGPRQPHCGLLVIYFYFLTGINSHRMTAFVTRPILLFAAKALKS